jgi:hypothetical protein
MSSALPPKLTAVFLTFDIGSDDIKHRDSEPIGTSFLIPHAISAMCQSGPYPDKQVCYRNGFAEEFDHEALVIVVLDDLWLDGLWL